MVVFLQVLFFVAAALLIQVNVQEFSRWQDSRKEGSVRPYPIKWFHFTLTSLAALGCVINILLDWAARI